MVDRPICRQAQQSNPSGEAGAFTCTPGSVVWSRDNSGPDHDEGSGRALFRPISLMSRRAAFTAFFLAACLPTVQDGASQHTEHAPAPRISEQPAGKAAEAGQVGSFLSPYADAVARPGSKVDATITLTAQKIAGECPDTGAYEVCENSGAYKLDWHLTRREGFNGRVTIDVQTSDETAVAGLDYVAVKQTLVYPPGVSQRTDIFLIIDDRLAEPTETFRLFYGNPIPDDLVIWVPDFQITIFDDDEVPKVSFDAASETSVEECGGEVSYSVVLDPVTDDLVTVDYATSEGSATADEDYGSVGGRLIFAPGETEKTVTVPILVDNTPEDNETFSIALLNPVNAVLGNNERLTVTIEDAACRIAMSVADASAIENAGTMTFAVTLEEQIADILTVRYTTADGTAVAGQDYTESAGQLTFNPFSTEQIISVPILDDKVAELNETFGLTLSGLSNTTLVDVVKGTATGTILDDEIGEASLSVADASVAEDAGPMEFTVTLSIPLAEELSVDFRTVDATAEAGFDYTATSGTVTFAAGETKQAVLVPILADTVIEADETFTVMLSGPSIAAIPLLRETATGTIQDDDLPTLSVADAVAAEGAGHAAFDVRLSEESPNPVQVRYRTTDGTARAGLDYGMAGDIVTFEPGVTEVTIEVAVLDDTLDEGDEIFTLTLEDVEGAILTHGQATGTIVDNDDPPGLSISDATAAESAGSMAFTVRLDAASGKIVSVEYATSDGTAEAGRDYDQTAGTVTFESGAIAQTVSVAVLVDAVDEDDETFRVSLSRAENGTVADDQATGTIIDDNESPGLSIADASASESDGNMVFAVTLDAASARAVTVQFSTSDGTAEAGMDFTGQSGTMTFAAGDTARQMVVPVLDDLVDEDTEEFTASLSTPVNATLKDGDAAGRILDDDARGITVSETALEIEEGSSKTYAVVLATQPTTNVVVEIGGASGDVSVDRMRLVFTPDNWNTAQTVRVFAAEDDDAAPDEVVTLTHTAVGGDYGGLSAGSISVTIRENDVVGVIIAPTVLAVEEGSSASYTIVLASAPSGLVTVSMTADLTATDIRVDPVVLTFSAEDWNQARPVAVTALEDLDVVQDNPIPLPHMVGGADYEGVSAAVVVVTIMEDETAWEVVGADWLARFGRTVASQAMATIGSRLLDVTHSSAGVRVGSISRGPAGLASYVPGREGLHPRRLLVQSSFDFSSTRRSDDTVERTMAWGRVADIGIAGRGNGFDLDGNLLTSIVGGDYERNRVLVGVGASFVWADGGYDFGIGVEGQGSVTTFLTSMYPYARYRFTDRLMAWGLLGYGIGSLALKDDTAGLDADAGVTMRMVGVGAYGSLVPAGNAGGFDLGVKSDAFIVRTESEATEFLVQSYGDALRVRLALQGSYRIRLGVSSVLTPSLEVAARQDAGHAENGAGMELVGSLLFAGGALTFEAYGHRLMIHRDDKYEEWGLGATLRYTPAASDRGLSLAVHPTWGRSSTGVDLLWTSHRLAGLGVDQTVQQRRLATEVSYGLGSPDHQRVVTPYVAVDIAGAQSRAVRVGGRWRLGSSFRVHLEGGRRSRYYGHVEHQVMLGGVLHW